MAIQARRDVTNLPFILGGTSYAREAETFAQDAARAATLVKYTAMAQNATTRQWVPLTDVAPSGTAGRLLTGAIGPIEDLQAIVDGSFRCTIDSEVVNTTGLDFSNVKAMTDQPGTATTGAIGAPELFQAIPNGEFSIDINGLTHDVIGLDFSNIKAVTDTPAYLTCDTNGSLLAAWQAVTGVLVGDFQITVNGVVIDIVGLDFAAILDLYDVAEIVNDAAAGRFWCTYDAALNIYSFWSPSEGADSTISLLGPIAAPVNDLSGTVANTFFNGEAAPAAVTAGTGGTMAGETITSVINAAAAGAFTCHLAGNTIVFVSPTTGSDSTVSVLGAVAGGGGVDISGAALLNGLAAVLTVGTGGTQAGETVASVINAALAGRATCYLSGGALTIISSTVGAGSQVSVLSAHTVGTDISGPGMLNGRTGVGTATAGTGYDGTNLPSGIYLGDTITAAELVAGTVVNRPVLVGGCCTVDEDQIVFEGGLTLNSICVQTKKTVRAELAARGIYAETAENITNFEN